MYYAYLVNKWNGSLLVFPRIFDSGTEADKAISVYSDTNWHKHILVRPL